MRRREMDEGRVEAEKGMMTKKEQAQFDLAISTLTKDLALEKAMRRRLEAVEAEASRLFATCGSVKARHSAGGLCMDVEYAGGQSWSDPE